MEKLFVPIHILALLYSVWNIVHADHMGFNWMRGKIATLDKDTIEKYHKGSWIGLMAMIVTGLIIFSNVKANIIYPQFYIKMGFVTALVINGFVIGKLSSIPTKKTFASLSTKEKIPLFISGAVSTISWIGAVIMAGFILTE